MKKTAVITLALIFLMALSGCCLSHSWEPATCVLPETCAKCGKTKGAALGHTWKEATCTEPETCTKCAETMGTALGHVWKEATCTDPEICEKCGSEQKSALGHVGVWQTESEAKLYQYGYDVEICKVCNEELNKKRITKKPEVNPMYFNFEEDEFLKYLNSHTSSTYYFGLNSADGKTAGLDNDITAYSIHEDYTYVGMLMMKSDEEGNVIMIAPATYENTLSVALAAHIGSFIDSTYNEKDSAILSLVTNKAYTGCGMDAVTGKMGEFYVTFLTPEDIVD